MSGFELKIRSYMDAAFPILYLNTFEEEKAKQAICRISEDVAKIKIPEWDGTDRVCDLHSKIVMYEISDTLEDILDDRMEWEGRQILVLRNINTFIHRPEIIARLKKIAESIHNGTMDATIFIISPVLEIPKELEKHITVVEMDFLEVNEIQQIIENFCQLVRVEVSRELKNEFAGALKGLSEFEIENILQLAYSENGDLQRKHISLIFDQKQQMIKKSGMLEMIPLQESILDIGGLEILKQWLKRKAVILSRMEEAKAFGVDIPKGVLIAGLPGCGKSLTAKAAAKLFQIPLLRLDMGRLLGKYVGESEENMRKAIGLAEAISPCVLWVDELEKAFAGTGGDETGSEVTTRLFGSFLTWLQEKKTAVFVVATANNITKLPPELLRKGRFDEIFFVGLPDMTERRKILEIHIKKRRPADFPDIRIDQLARETEGFCGADIEGIIQESVETVFAEERKSLKTEDIQLAMKNTVSLSEIMKDRIHDMEKEYRDRRFKNASESR